jgi:hypothetical protein
MNLPAKDQILCVYDETPVLAESNRLKRQKREFVELSRQALAHLLWPETGRLSQSAFRRWDERLEPYMNALGACHDPVPDDVLAIFGYETGETWSSLIQTLYFVDGLEGVVKRLQERLPHQQREAG